MDKKEVAFQFWLILWRAIPAEIINFVLAKITNHYSITKNRKQEKNARWKMILKKEKKDEREYTHILDQRVDVIMCFIWFNKCWICESKPFIMWRHILLLGSPTSSATQSLSLPYSHRLVFFSTPVWRKVRLYPFFFHLQHPSLV